MSILCRGVLLIALAVAGCSAAKEMPVRLIERPLTLHKGMAEVEAGLGVQLKDDAKRDIVGRLGMALGERGWRYGLTDRVTWSIPTGLRYAVKTSHGEGTDVALNFGFLPVVMARRGTMLVTSLGAMVKIRLSRQLWIDQLANVVVLRHFDGAFFFGGTLSASLAQQISDMFSMRLGMLAERTLGLTTLTSRPIDSLSVVGRANWTLAAAIDLHCTAGGRVTIGETPKQVPFVTVGVTLRW